MDSKDAAFTFQGIATARAALSPHFDVTLKYRYFDVEKLRLASDYGDTKSHFPLAEPARRSRLQHGWGSAAASAAPSPAAAASGAVELHHFFRLEQVGHHQRGGIDPRQRRRGLYLPMGGQIVDATLVAAPKQRNTAAEKDAIKAGKSATEIWPDQPAKAAQKDTDARWTLKFAKARALPDGRPGIDIAIPSFGYKSSIAICRRYGFIRRGKVTVGARFDGRMLRDVVTNDNTASDVWADTAYRSRSNEAWLRSISRVSRVHRKKPKGKPMPARTARANAAKSTVRARIEHVFARQKFIRTIGIVRAETKITLANLAYNIDRLVFHERRSAMG